MEKPGTNPSKKPDAADKERHPVGRVGAPDDIAALVPYLISPEATFIPNFVVDGGMTKKMIYI